MQTLSIHGSVPKAIAIGLVEAAPFVLSTILALAIGLGRIRVPPRTLLIADCVLRSLTFATLGILAVLDQLTLPILIAGLLFGATFRLAGSSSGFGTAPRGATSGGMLMKKEFSCCSIRSLLIFWILETSCFPQDAFAVSLRSELTIRLGPALRILLP